MAEPVPLFPSAEPPDPILQVEQMAVGALLMNSGKALALFPASFSTSHYLDPIHRDIHEVIASTGAGAPGLLIRSLGLAGVDAKYIATLMSACPTWTQTPQFAEAITEDYHRRGLIAIAENMLTRARGGTKDAAAASIAMQALAALDAQLSQTERHRPGLMLNQAMDAALEHATMAERSDASLGCSTGMTSVDAVLGSLEPAEFYVLAARPGVGKTALGVKWALNAARQCKATGAGGVICFSLEMSAKALGRRVLAEASGISVTDLKRGQVGNRIDTLTRARFDNDGLPLQIEDAGGQPLVAIRQKARAAQRKFGKLALIMVDHLQIVAPDEADRRNGATQAVGRVSNGLRDIAKEFDAPVLCLSQLSRELLKRDDKRPNLGDLRQAGDIEQDADVVMFLHREEMFLSKSPPTKTPAQTLSRHESKLQDWKDAQAQSIGKAELIFAKVRDGALCTVPLRWHGKTTSFGEDQPQIVSRSQTDISAWDDRYFNDDQSGEF